MRDRARRAASPDGKEAEALAHEGEAVFPEDEPSAHQ